MDKKTEVINTDANTLKELVDGSALTVEGLAEPAIDGFLDWVEETAGLRVRRAYVTKGSLANREWGLTGDNAYQDDLNIVSVKLDDMKDWKKVVMPRFRIGGRWIDDVYANAIRREHAA